MSGIRIEGCGKVKIDGGDVGGCKTGLEIESCDEVVVNEMEFIDTETSIKASKVGTLKAKGNKETTSKSD